LLPNACSKPPRPYVRVVLDIQERVEDALLLWREGRREGAFLLALVAVAARARRNDPQTASDREVFEQFIARRFSVRISLEFRGQLEPLERIFYKWLRCELVHEGGLPVDVRFMEGCGDGELSVRAGGAPEYLLLVSHGWFHKLIQWALAED
jgi:hypothetical protein